VLASVPGTDASDEVHLLATCVQPGTIETEVGPVRADFETELVNVERNRGVNVIDVDRYVMDADRFYTSIMALGPVAFRRTWLDRCPCGDLRSATRGRDGGEATGGSPGPVGVVSVRPRTPACRGG
jgi:hypothetical protein